MNSDSQVQTPPESSASIPPRLREARFDDYAQIAALARRFGLGFEDETVWQHLWKDNPAYRAIHDTFPIGWILEDADSGVRGYLGNIPLNYELEGKRLLAAATRSWVVDRGYRGYALLLLRPFYQQASVDLFLGTSVNSQSLVASSLFRNVRVPVGTWDRSLFWITHARGFTDSFFTKKGWNFAKPFSYPVSLGLSLRDRALGSGFRQGVCDPAVVSIEDFDERFDAFWSELKKKKAGLLLGVRDRETLDWHFQFALRNKEAWVYTLQAGGRISGYAIFLRQARPQVGLNRVCLVDFQCVDDKKCSNFFLTALWSAFERCRQESIHMLELIGLPLMLEGSAELAAPHHRKLDSWMYFYKTNNPALGSTLKNPSVWEPSLYDGDSTL